METKIPNAEMALEFLEFYHLEHGSQLAPPSKRALDAISILRQAIEQTEKQEPYGYLWFTHHMERRFTHYKPKEEQHIGDVTPVYTAPPKREWVGLTDEEMTSLRLKSVMDGMTRTVSDFEYIRAIEAKLKEKNS